MWRIPSLKATAASSCGTRRCLRDRSRAFATVTNPAAANSRQQNQPPTRPLVSNHQTLQYNNNNYDYRKSSLRSFHSGRPIASSSWNSESIGSLYDKEDDDPDDPNDEFSDEDYENEFGNNIDQDDPDAIERERYRLQQKAINDELDQRRGRPWTDPWEISEEMWMSTDTSMESLPDWSPQYVSRIALERLQVLSNNNQDGGGIPTLEEIGEFSLPELNPDLHPARKAKTYAKYRKTKNFQAVQECVNELAKDRVEKLLQQGLNPENESDLQESVDSLFEDLQEEAKVHPSMDILSKHPSFFGWVDRALEEYLRASEKEALQSAEKEQELQEDSKKKATADALKILEQGGEESSESETTTATSKTEEAAADTSNEEGSAEEEQQTFRDQTPVFMDCYDATEAAASGDKKKESPAPPIVPKILTPLGPHRHDGPGRMVEEWQLAAHDTTKRIMLRECTQTVANLLAASNEEVVAPKVYVHGRQGVGKSALLAAIVASARKSGHLVLYLPDGDRLRKNGFFVTPSTHPDRQGMYDLQNLSQEALEQLLEAPNAKEQLEGVVADRATLELYFKESHFKRLDDYRAKLENSSDDGSISLLDLIAWAKEYKKHAPMCYSVVVNRLMHQKDVQFTIVMDEFNCLFDKGHYFHMSYDENVREAIPYHKINLFEPIMAAMDIATTTAEEEEDHAEDGAPSLYSKSLFDTTHTSVVVGTSESHAVAANVTVSLTGCAQRHQHVTAVEVPTFTSLEADHILANFEATGVGKLRLDQGDTLMNLQEVEYLKMASGSIGQKLLDVSIM